MRIGFLEWSEAVNLECSVRRMQVAKFARPAWIVKHSRLGTQGDVRVDERGSTQAAADEYVNVRMHVKIIESRPRAHLRAVRQVSLKFERSLG